MICRTWSTGLFFSSALLAGLLTTLLMCIISTEADVDCPCAYYGNYTFDCSVVTERELSCSFASQCSIKCPTKHCFVHFNVSRTNSMYTAKLVRANCITKWRGEHTSSRNETKTGCSVQWGDTEPRLDGQHQCICKGHNCSQLVTLRLPPVTTARPVTMAASTGENDGLGSATIIPVAVTSVAVFVCSILVVYYLRQRKLRIAANWLKAPLSPSADMNGTMESLLFFGNVRPVKMDKAIVCGRFGVVWRAHCEGEQVAVKIFSESNRESWMNECRLYSEGFMQHPAILAFWYGEERHNDRVNTLPEFWLVTSFHEMGNLTQFLCKSVLSWEELGLLADSLACGLAYLHDDILAVKPAIAHRDLKSTNILLKPGPRCVIADFGLAIELFRGINRKLMEESGQAGTPRYMAPEGLEARINLNDPVSFLQMDVYSVSLVMWELCSRCHDLSSAEDPLLPYSLPYQDKLEGNRHPTIDRMREIVIKDHCRPPVPNSWSISKEGSLLVRTLTECWEHHPESRLTAANIYSRIRRLWTPEQPLTSLPTSAQSNNNEKPDQMPLRNSQSKLANETSSTAGGLASPESTSATDVEHSKSIPTLMDADSGCVSGGITTDIENSSSWGESPPRTYRSFSQPLYLSRVTSGKGNESSASLSSEVIDKARYSHTPRVFPKSWVNCEGSSAFETSGGYEAQKSSSESSSSDAAMPSARSFSKALPTKLARPQSANSQCFSAVNTESSI